MTAIPTFFPRLWPLSQQISLFSIGSSILLPVDPVKHFMIRCRQMVYTKAFFKKCGSRGGKVGGKARAAALSPARRSEIARMGALAKEAKKKNGN